MRAFLAVPFVLLSTAAWSQQLVVARQMIAEAYGRLSLDDALTVNLSGQTVTGSTTVPFDIQMAVQRQTIDGKAKIYLEGLVDESGKKAKRFVGDGDHLWVYDAKRNVYSVVPYGEGQTEAQQGSTLFTTLKRVTHGPSEFVAALLADLDRCRTAGSGNAMSTWTPWIGASDIGTSRLSIACNTRPPTDAILTYAFRLDDDQRLWFTSAAYESHAVVGGQGQSTSWSLLYTESLPSTVDFTFNPGDATPVSITLAQGGG